MKYTRYDIKRKKKKNYYKGIVLISILTLAILIVVVISPFIFRNKDQTTAVDIKNSQGSVSKNAKESNFIMIQIGAFDIKENADKLKLELTKTLGDSYIIQDATKSRVVYGIYPESESTKILKDLTDKKIASSKMTFVIKDNDLCNKEIIGLLDANLKVINYFSSKDIKDPPNTKIQTDDLKSWTSALKEADKKSVNYTILEDVKKHTLNLKKDFSKSDIDENYIYLYGILKKIK